MELGDLDGRGEKSEHPPSLIGWLASSGLAVGSDISRIAMPIPFFLPKTMLDMLQMNEMRRVDLLLRATTLADPLARFKAVLAYYFSCCLLEDFGRKPLYSSPGETIGSKYACADGSETHFFAEQLEGPLPSATAIMWNDAKKLHSSGTITIKEELWGSSVHAIPNGLRTIRIGDESFTMTPPSIAVRLLRGFSEYTGKSVIECTTSHLRAVVEFVPKAVVLGTADVVKGTIIDTTTDAVVCTLAGQWSDKIWAQAADNSDRDCIHAFSEVSCELTPVYNGDDDTRLLWAEVSSAIRRGDWAGATEARRHVEARAPIPPKYFARDPTTGRVERTTAPLPGQTG